jgi:hypothetical protein
MMNLWFHARGAWGGNRRAIGRLALVARLETRAAESALHPV